MGRPITGAVVLSAFLCALPPVVRADTEAPNAVRIAADNEFGRCYVRSVPKHDFDPWGEPRQQGTTTAFYVTKDGDIPVDTYDWYSGTILVKCTMFASTRTSPEGTVLPVVHLVRFGPWHRRPPGEHDLAIAFYRNGKLLKSHSTFDIAGTGKLPRRCGNLYENMVGSISHYIVFAWLPGPQFDSVRISTGAKTQWADGLKVTTVDGRLLSFELDTGELVGTEKVAEPDKVFPRFDVCHPAPSPEEKN